MATRPVYYMEEPRLARWLFGSSQAAWIWLVARIWLGWEWFQSGWGKVFGGNITWKFWDWGHSAYSLTGDANIGWIRSGTVVGPDGMEQHRAIGDSVAGYASNAIQNSQGPHPDVAYSWYVDFLKWIQHTAAPVFAYVVAFGEVIIGIALILGLFTGIFAFLGMILNFSYVFGGSAGVNPAMIVVSIGIVLAWRNAGYYGLDRFVLPALGTPWKPGEVFNGGDTSDEKVPVAPT